MNQKIILVGGFHEVIELCEESNLEIVGIIDRSQKGNYRGYQIFGDDNSAANVQKMFPNVPIVITPDVPQDRQKLVSMYTALGFEILKIISQKAIISKSAIIGKGTIVQDGVNISAEVSIGNYVKLNTRCNVMHNTHVGVFSTVAPDAVLLGNVTVGDECYVGSNATILPNLKIGNRSIIGAGAVVTKDVEQYSIYVGNPAKKIREFKDKEELLFHFRAKKGSPNN
jgi:sugar O-acyltransferase (sialic acid O-acetyltransferase NeuD family)